MKMRSLLAIGVLAGALGASSTLPPATRLHWIVSESSGHRLETAMSADAYRAKLDNPNTYEIMNLPDQPDPLPHAKHIKFYRDETLLEHELAAGALNAYDGVLLDDEAYRETGNTTPQSQIDDPVTYFARAARVLHGANKLFVATVGFKVGTQGAFWTRTLPQVVQYPDVLDFQTQAAEGTDRFDTLVARLSQIFHANGGKQMIVGLAISPRGQAKGYDDLLRSYRAALAIAPPVDGFWLNIAVKSNSCTGCTSHPDVDPAAQLLMNTTE